MRAQRYSVNNAVSGVPPSVYAGAIQKHLDAETNSFFRGVGTIADRELLDRDDTERCGDNPACRTGNPGPAILVGIEANVAIGGLEFPSPEPVRLSAPLCDDSMEDLLTGAGKISHLIEGAKGKGCCQTALRISQKGRPTSISSLQTQQLLNPRSPRVRRFRA